MQIEYVKYPLKTLHSCFELDRLNVQTGLFGVVVGL